MQLHRVTNERMGGTDGIVPSCNASMQVVSHSYTPASVAWEGHRTRLHAVCMYVHQNTRTPVPVLVVIWCQLLCGGHWALLQAVALRWVHG